MKQSKISRRSFLLGLGAVSAAAVLTACGGSSSASTAASGSAASGSSVVYRTLDQIKESGTINIGVFSDKNPFGYVDENGEYQGYDVYFARRLGEDLGVEINFVSTEAANRIEYLQTGKADVILAKGQGNFETMHGCGLNVYYSFLCKCDWFQQRFGMEKNKGMFVRERSQ